MEKLVSLQIPDQVRDDNVMEVLFGNSFIIPKAFGRSDLDYRLLILRLLRSSQIGVLFNSSSNH